MALDELLSTTSLTIIRPSSLPGWADCPRREAAKLFRGLIEGFGFKLRRLEPHIGAQIGTATHTGARLINEWKIEHGSVTTQAAPVDEAIDEFQTLIKTEGAIWDSTTPSPSDGCLQIVNLVESYRAHIAPKITPIAAEERLEMKLGEGILISGRKDLSTREPNAIRDVKTGRPRSCATQLGTYAMLEEANKAGVRIDHAFEDRLPRVPVAIDQPLPDTVEYDLPTAKREAYHLIMDIGEAVDLFKRRVDNAVPFPEEAFRANPLSSLCTSRYCPAHSTPFCRLHRKET